jgi:predicted ATP-dependent serine protease
MYRCLQCGSRFSVHTPVCSHCFTSHALALEADRPRAQIDGEVELTSARELARSTWQDAGVPAYTFGLRRGALVVAVGRSGAGKSTLVVRAIDSMRAPSLLVSLEEPGGPSLAMRLARVGAKRDDLLVCSRGSVDQIASIIRDRKIAAVAIDSVQRSMFEPRDLRHLLLTLPSLVVLFATSQITKTGDIRGTEELRHEADVVLEVDAMRWTVSKSRYETIGGSGDVLPPTPEEVQHVDQ